MTLGKPIFLILLASTLSACSTWAGTDAGFGISVRTMVLEQSQEPGVVTRPMEAAAVDAAKVEQAMEAYHGERAGGGRGASLPSNEAH